MHAQKYMTTNYHHPRPYVDFGNLRGPEGNAFMVIGNAANTLKNHGYQYEAEELSSLCFKISPNYDTSFDKISFFLNFLPAPKPFDINDYIHSAIDSGDAITMKIDKADLINHQKKVEEYNDCLYLNNNVAEEVKNSQIDIEAVNNLGRNAFFYISDMATLKDLSEYIEEYMQRDDLCGSNALMHVAHRSLDIMLYLVTNFSHTIDLTKQDVFKRDFLTQLFLVGSEIERDYKQKGVKNLNDVCKFMLIASYVKNLPGYSESVDRHALYTPGTVSRILTQGPDGFIAKDDLEEVNLITTTIEKDFLNVAITSSPNKSKLHKV